MKQSRIIPCLLVLAAPASASLVAGANQPASSLPAPYHGELRAAALRPAGRLSGSQLRVDQATFRFEQADLYLLDPVAGVSTGAVILGRGRFELVPPDGVERQQIDKYYDAETVDTAFKRLVLRFTDDTAERLRELAAPGPGTDVRKATKVWKDLHKDALDDRLVDLDARVAMDLAERAAGTSLPGRAYFYAEVDSEGGLSFDVDPFNMEEIRLFEAHGADRSWDNWSSFHLAADYATYSPGDGTLARLPENERWRPAVEVEQVVVDLAIDGDDIDAVTDLVVRALRPQTTLRLSISPILTVREVRWQADNATPWDPASAAQADHPRAPHAMTGDALPFLQAQVGRGLDEDRTEPRVTVFLPRPLAAGERVVLRVRYDGQLLERLPTRDYVTRDSTSWYPQHLHARRSRFQTLFRTAGNRKVATGGVLEGQWERDGWRLEHRVIGRPENGISFHYGDLKVDEYARDGYAPISLYSSPNTVGFAPGNRKKVLDDLTSATDLYRDYFGPPPFDRLVITETPLYNGQSFAGFLLLSFDTFGGMHTGEAEMFRTHELAHQWWGNSVAWTSYRDQWLSEGFAQYAAALHSLLALDDVKQFDDLLEAWAKDVLARRDVGQSLGMRHFGHTPAVLRDSDGPETGPIWVGYRLASDKTPPDYRLHVYEKGAYVLHMLRMMLLDWETGDDQRFRDMMRGFYAAHAGSNASTEDFLGAVSDAFGEPMDWFFDQWVYGIEIPKYDADLRARQAGGGQWRLQGRIRQREVGPDFRMLVPVRVAYADDTTRVFRIEVVGEEVAVDLPLASKPDDIDFNPMHAVLARR